MIGRVLGLLIVAFILLHGYFYFAFGTIDPCTAATFHIVNKGRSDVERAAGLLFSAAIERAIRSKGLLVCYRTAITGEAPEGLP